MGAIGQTEVNFGAFPGKTDASVAVADAAILAGSRVEAWIAPVATAEHTADEHLVETIKIIAGPPVAGVGFTIYGLTTAQWCGHKSHNLYGRFTVNWGWF